jgi:GNAT superfamily N-acetyltransferase
VIEIREVSAEAVRPIRQQVLRPSQTIEEMIWAHDLEPSTKHFAALDGERIIGIVTAYPAEMPEKPDKRGWQFRGMATLPDVRGQGIGKALITKCLEAANGAELLWCDARISAMPFYEKLGFQKIGESFEKPMAGPHWRMYRDLP